MSQDINYEDDRKMGDLNTRKTKMLLGDALIQVANDFEDTQHNTDLIQETPNGEIIRFPERWRVGDFSDPDFVKNYNMQYKYEVTFRCHKNSGEATEWHKMMADGYGDFDIYGWLDQNGNIISYTVIDLNRFRDWFNNIKPDIKRDRANYDKMCGALRLNNAIIGHVNRVKKFYKNGDIGYDYFYVFDWRKIPGIVVKTSVDWKEGNNDIKRKIIENSTGNQGAEKPAQ